MEHKRLIGGLNKDSLPEDISKEDYIDARNIINIEENNIFSKVVEKGFKEIPGFNIEVLGVLAYSERLIVFGKNLNDVSHIGYFDKNLNYFTVIEDIGFRFRKEIKAECKINYLGQYVVYFVDGENRPRYLNLDDPVSNIETTSIFKHVIPPNITINNIVEGGRLKAGAYCFFTRYQSKSLNGFNYSDVSDIVYINEAPLVQNNKLNQSKGGTELTNKSINIEINNIDVSYDFLEIGVYHNDRAYIFDKYVIKSNTYKTNFNGKTIYEIEPTVLNTSQIIYDSAKSIEQLNGRLFLANLTSYYSEELDKYFKDVVDDLELEVVVKSIDDSKNQVNQTNPNSVNGYAYFKTPKSFQRNEVYSFGLVFVTDRESFVYHIPSIKKDGTDKTLNKKIRSYVSESLDENGNKISHWKMPDYDSTVYGQPYSYPNINILGIKCLNLKLKPPYDIFVKEIYLVRQERNTLDKMSILAQGIGNNLLLQDGAHISSVRNGTNNGSPNISNVVDFENTPSYLNRDKTYTINPFFSNTHIIDFNAAIFVNGRFVYKEMTETRGQGFKIGVQHFDTINNWYGNSDDEVANKTVAFYSPDFMMTDELLNMAHGCKINPICRIHTKIEHVVDSNEQTVFYGESYQKFIKPWQLSTGWYTDHNIFPFILQHRAPYWFLMFDYTKPYSNYFYKSENNKCTIENSIYATNNDIVYKPEDFSKLKTLVPKSNYYLNNFGNEGFHLFSLDSNLPISSQLQEYQQILFVIIGGTCNYGLNTDFENTAPIDEIFRMPWRSRSRTSGMNSIHIGNRFVGPKHDNIVVSDTDDSWKATCPSVLKKGLNHNLESNRYIYNIEVDNKQQYGQLHSSEYILCHVYKNLNNTSEEIYAGDVFITPYSIRHSLLIPYRFWYEMGDVWEIDEESVPKERNNVKGQYGRPNDKDSAELRSLEYIYFESRINSYHRHRLVEKDDNGNVISISPPYYPESSKWDVMTYDEKYEYSKGYNIDFSKDRNIKKYYSAPFNFKYVTNYNNRIIYSERHIEGESTDSYLMFLPANYKDYSTEYGPINDIVTYNQDLYSFNLYGLLKLNAQPSEILSSDKTDLYIGTGSLLSREPIRIIDYAYYGGTSQALPSYPTPHGLYFIDVSNGNVLKLGSNGLEEISTNSMLSYFKNNSSDYRMLYDEFNKRLLLSINDETLSFSLLNNKWISFHDYSLGIGTNFIHNLISFKNKKAYLHNVGPYLQYYDKPKIASIKLVFNESRLQHKTFDNLEIFAKQFVKRIKYETNLQAIENEIKYYSPKDIFTANTRFIKDRYQVTIPKVNNFERLKGNYLIVELISDDYFSLQDLILKFRQNVR